MGKTRENVIVSLTSWEKRIKNIPMVLDSVFAQTIKPDCVVLNLADSLILPETVVNYLEIHQVEVNRVEDTKVYKKIIPTLKKYPDDCIISIDDDWIYPPEMIQDFFLLHEKYPNNPISGNKELYMGFPVHCGCASLTKAAFFDNIELIDEDVIAHCKSDDLVYSYFAIKSGHPYIWTDRLYFTNMIPYNSNDAYTDLVEASTNTEQDTLDYLINRFGPLPDIWDCYGLDPVRTKIFRKFVDQMVSSAYVLGETSIRNSYSYKLGHTILSPFFTFWSWTRNNLKHSK